MSKLHNFEWDSNPNLEGKFGEEFEEQVDKNLNDPDQEEKHDFSFKSEEEEEEGKDKEEGKSDSKKEEKPDHKFSFGDEEEEEEEDDNKSDTSKEKNKDADKQSASKIDSRGVISFLNSKGLLDLNDDVKLEDLSDAEIDDHLEDFIDESNEAYFASQVADLPAAARNLLKVAVQGGDVNKYLETLSSSMTATLKLGMSLDTEKNQELVIRSTLASQGVDSEEIEEQIEFLKSKEGRLEATAKKHYDKWEKDVKKKQDDLLEIETSRKNKAKENSRKYRNDLTEFISKNKEVSNMPISVSDKKELSTYIANPAYEDDKGQSFSEFQKDLHEALKDTGKTVALAKILKSGFDFSKLIEKGAAAAMKQTKNTIQNQSSNKSEREKRTPRRLVDILDEQ